MLEIALYSTDLTLDLHAPSLLRDPSRVKDWDKRTIEEGTLEAVPKELTETYAHSLWGTKCEGRLVQSFYRFF